MTLWLILTAMTALVAIWAALPFLRRENAVDAGDHARSSTVYRDQLRQIEADLKAGVISDADAEAARAEAARRVVLAEREEKAEGQSRYFGDRTYAAVGIAGAVALGSAILYAKLGEPDRIPRGHGAGAVAGSGGALPPRHPAIPRGQQQSGPADTQEGGLPRVDGMIDRLVQRLKANPDDPNGWRMLGWSYASQGRFKDAVSAYDEAIKRQPENGDLYSARGELMVRIGNGAVTSEAANVFEEALKRDKENPRARYFLGLKKEQAGDRKAALDDWIGILQRAPATEPWARDLRERVEQLASELKIDVAARLPVWPAAGQSGGRGPGILGTLNEEARGGAPSSAAAGGSAAGAKGAGDDDQAAMIRKMVDGLAARLETQPKDFEGWSRLIRSRTVLGEKDKARTALAKAREIFSDTPDALSAFGATARELGLEQ